ncbi:allophanate hydrolase [Seonamhaeicola sp. S2-3]|uniref:5-oxoprolinase subunit PxpB n=1 Tax=Seonamhaeicola sp. S2-3 TaxID=1936081 RepID=UPI000972C614|nr:5-oxoprolinase subunit PxpB [Seonamhaeicola sp. S2-3]APY12198.1 allophanate hydrolase [Seonamhaeicola sp. S2-3]
MSYQLTYRLYGAFAILIEWPQKISKDILYDVLNFKHKILEIKHDSVLEITHAYCSMLVSFKESVIDFDKEVEALKSIYNKDSKETKTHYKLWKIPVCYDFSFGIDLKTLAEAKGLSVNEVIKLHSQALYTVYFIGFLPGFLYLGGLNEVLYTPRKDTPRLKVEKGAVAIGGNQTGVYPNESPGGWNIIGNSPINFFNIKNKIPCFASAGDVIQFYPISLKEHQDIKILVDAGVYQLESEVVND